MSCGAQLFFITLSSSASPFQSISPTPQSSKTPQSVPISLGKPRQSLPTLQWEIVLAVGLKCMGTNLLPVRQWVLVTPIPQVGLHSSSQQAFSVLSHLPWSCRLGLRVLPKCRAQRLPPLHCLVGLQALPEVPTNPQAFSWALA